MQEQRVVALGRTYFTSHGKYRFCLFAGAISQKPIFASSCSNIEQEHDFCKTFKVILLKMKWEDYKLKFVFQAKLIGIREKDITRYLEYAKYCYEQKIPIIYDQIHLCRLLGYKEEFIYSICNDPDKFYRHFSIKKKNGKERQIYEPLPELKNIQLWILHSILDNCIPSDYAKAYRKNYSLKDNVRFHRKQKKVLCLDIKSFFDRISSWMVYQFFLNLHYREDVAMMLTSLCCRNCCLPQGAPTSAALSNLVMKEFDENIARHCLKRKIRFTRYADDMTFSGDFNETEIIQFVRKECKKIGMNLNDEKTHVRKQGQQQRVTGVVVNEKIQVPLSLRREIRQNMYYIEKYGLDSHLQRIHEERQNYLQHLLGQIEFVLFINPKDLKMRRYRDYLSNYPNSLDQ